MIEKQVQPTPKKPSGMPEGFFLIFLILLVLLILFIPLFFYTVFPARTLYSAVKDGS